MPLFRSLGAAAAVRNDTAEATPNYVLSIDYKCDFVSDPGDRSVWFSKNWTSRPKFYEDLYGLFSESDVDQAYQIHSRYYDDQKHVKATEYDFKTLESAFSCLPNLRGVHISWPQHGFFIRSRDPFRDWGDEVCHVSKVMGNISRFFESHPPGFVRENTSIFAACKLAPKALSWFDCEKFDLEVLLDYDGEGENEDESGHEGEVGTNQLSRFNKDSTKDLGFPLVSAAFESLTFINLNITTKRWTPVALYHKLGAALCSARSLETLTLNESGGDALSFTVVLGSSTWPNLKHLSLGSMNIREHDLPVFLARHPSIATFALRSTSAVDFEWAMLFESSAFCARLRQLRLLTLSGYWGSRTWSRAFYDEKIEVVGGFRIDSIEELEDSVDMHRPFAKWVQDLTGIYSLADILKRYIEAGPGGAVSFPLRTRLEVVDVLEKVPRDNGYPEDGLGSMLTANEKIVGEEYRNRNLYKDWYQGSTSSESESGSSKGSVAALSEAEEGAS
ncbi:hypothetical protein V492_00081 [Pseudogymnoascus sp. VKM F-4246]|nr:hypothetical protein V492_00081 [Pseudogymnoascus sp. VKM F-4246]